MRNLPTVLCQFLELLEMEESKNAFGALFKSVYVSTV